MSTPLIAVFSQHRHPRLRYALREAGRSLGYQFRLLTDQAKWVAIQADAKLSLTENSTGEKAYFLPIHTFLSGSSPAEKDLRVSFDGTIPLFFEVETAKGRGHDLLAMIFFCLSRYEEYDYASTDQHGRFAAAESHALKNGYLHLPVVRLWARQLADSLKILFPDLPSPAIPPLKFVPTYDIDLLWAWQHRGIRGFGAGLKDFLTGAFGRGWRRFTTPAANDPYLVLPFLEDLHWQHSLHPHYFWLLADNTDYRDPNPYPIPAAQREWMTELSEKWITGIHPGYRSMDEPALIREEAGRLAAITGHGVSHSRQHFLRFRLPETYRELRLAGISHDYSMGYADAVGWRAGTNQAFYWYDLEKEEQTWLLVHPFAAMDVTLKNYLNLDPEAACAAIRELAGGLQYFGGPFMLLWHNSSFADDYGWEGWREMYEQLVNDLSVKIK